MKKCIVVLQILILFSQSAFAQYTPAPSEKPISRTVPADYHPETTLVDSAGDVRIYNQYRLKDGQRVKVKGFVGKFGIHSFNDNFRQQLFDVENKHEGKVEIILTLTSTMGDAMVLKKRMELSGRVVEIVELPDELQRRFLERAEIAAQGGFKELWWDTKNKAQAILHPIQTANYAGSILKHQFQRPGSKDIYLAKFTLTTIGVTSTGAALGAMALGVGVDPMLFAVITGARMLLGGTMRAYNRTIVNLTRMNLFDDMAVSSTVQQTTRRLSTLGVAMGQLYYGIGHAIMGNAYPITQKQIFSNTATSGVIDTAAAIERNNRLSDKARDNIYKMGLVVGSLIGAVGSMGFIGPIVLEWGFLQITALQAGSLTIFSALLVSIVFFTHHVEIVAQKSIKELFNRLKSIQEARDKRLAEERAAAEKRLLQRLERRQLMAQSLDNIRLAAANRRANAMASQMCANLFKK